MPAKSAKKKASTNKLFESSDMPDEEENPNKPSKEERAFLKAVSKTTSQESDISAWEITVEQKHSETKTIPCQTLPSTSLTGEET